MANYKMAVLDIDGTILNSMHMLSNRTIQTIQRMSERNIPVCLCTGRNMNHALPIVKKLGIQTPFMSIDGKIMYDPKEQKIIYQNKLSPDVALTLIESIAAEHAYMEVVTPHQYLKYIKSKDLMKYNVGGTSLFMRAVVQRSYGAKFIKVLSDITDQKDSIFTIVAAGTEEVLCNIKNSVARHNIDTIDFVEAWQDYFIITPKAGKKSDGVKLLCAHYGIDMSEVVAIGDEKNDIDMLQMAGMGVAMGNAVAEVKEVADYITLDNNHDGAALALEKFF